MITRKMEPLAKVLVKPHKVLRRNSLETPGPAGRDVGSIPTVSGTKTKQRPNGYAE